MLLRRTRRGSTTCTTLCISGCASWSPPASWARPGGSRSCWPSRPCGQRPALVVGARRWRDHRPGRLHPPARAPRGHPPRGHAVPHRHGRLGVERRVDRRVLPPRWAEPAASSPGVASLAKAICPAMLPDGPRMEVLRSWPRCVINPRLEQTRTLPPLRASIGPGFSVASDAHNVAFACWTGLAAWTTSRITGAPCCQGVAALAGRRAAPAVGDSSEPVDPAVETTRFAGEDV